MPGMQAVIACGCVGLMRTAVMADAPDVVTCGATIKSVFTFKFDPQMRPA